jgi:2'-5' RNA ligase
MRLFVALDIPDTIRQAISAYVDDQRRAAPDAKWVRPESYHVTLKFIGEWRRDVREVIETLAKVEGPKVDFAIRGNGFFPSARSPRVFWVGIETEPWEQGAVGSRNKSAEGGDGLQSPSRRSEAPLSAASLSILAGKVDEACSALGIEREARAFSPHLTLARSGSGSPRPKKDEKAVPGMKRLAERIAAVPAPDFGTIHATEFFLYESKLSPGGAKYAKLAHFALG